MFSTNVWIFLLPKALKLGSLFGLQLRLDSYKVVSGVDIKADIVLPPGLKAGKHPLIIAWHGGALVG